MATDINKVFLIGRLTRDCEMKTLPNTTLCSFSIAVNRATRDQAGNWGDEASFFDVDLFGKQGEAIQGYLKKGKQVAVDGALRQNRWEQDGQKRSRVSIIAMNVQLLGGSTTTTTGSIADSGGYNTSGANMGGSYQSSQSAGSGSTNMGESTDFQDDIPF